MAYRETFGGDVDYAYSSGKRLRGAYDMASKLSQGASAFTTYTSKVKAAKNEIKNLQNEIDKLNEAQAKSYSADVDKKIDSFQKRIKDLSGAVHHAQIGLSSMAMGFDKVAKGMLKLQVTAITGVFDFLIDSIKRVYELQERWTRAIGGFNMKMGGMTAGLKGATRAATQWSGTIRGLTNGDIQEGIEMFGEFTMAIGRVVEKGDEFSRFGVQLARGFNLGGAGAGQLSKVFENIGMSAGEGASAMSELIDGANLAGIPVNMLAKDIEESSTYMARFGKEGAKAFVTGAAYARKFTIAMKDLQKATERFDMFDEAVTTMAKLNTAFGHFGNGVDLMLEDDPAARMEMIRQQFLSQGQTYDTLSVKQRRFAAETMGVTDDQLASLLSLKNANVTYAEFQAKQAAKEKSELNAKKQMEVMLRKTAQTMYAFGIAFDRVTVAIANAIKPLLEVLGLAKSGNKQFSSFGQVMESITVTVEEFFNSLARNEKWQAFMRELARDIQRLGRALRDFVMSGGAAELVGDLAVGMKKFYIFVRDAAIAIGSMLKPLIPVFVKIAEHSKEILFAWMAMKAGQKVGGIGDQIAEMGGGLSESVGKKFKRAGTGIAAGGIAAAGIGALGMGGETGAAIGGALGGLLGPLGGIGGAIVGSITENLGKAFVKSDVGKKVLGWLGIEKGKSKLEKSREDLAKQLKKESELRETHSSVLDAVNAKLKAESARREGLKKELTTEINKKGTNNKLSEEQLAMLRENLLGISRMTSATGVARDAVKNLAAGETEFTDKQLKALLESYSRYNDRVNNLNAATDEAVKLKLQELEFSKIGVGTKVLEAQAKMKQAQKSQAEADLKKIIDDKLVTPIGHEMVEALKSGDIAKIREKTGLSDDKIKLKQMQLTTKGEAAVQRDMDIAAQRHKVNKLEIEANKLNEEASKLRMKFDEEIFRTEMKQMLMKSDEFHKFAMMPGHSNMDPSALIPLFLRGNEKFVKENFGGEAGWDALWNRSLTAMASGGIVRRPTHALIGEAGPEAVIPLRAMARGRMRQPMKFGGSTASSLVTGGGSGTTSSVTIPVSVQIDGREIARAVAKSAITSR